MTKKEFENIVVKSLPPVLKSNLNKHKNSINENDFDIISKDLLIRAIKDFGLSLDNGLKLVRYYFDEILILYNGGKSEVYPGKTIINFESKTIGHVNNGRCEFKYTFWAIERFNRTLKLCEEQLNNQLNSTGKTVKGFDCKQYKDRLPLIYKAMTDEKYIKTDEETFINAFSGKYFTLHSPIVWLIVNQFGHGNKLALADFLKEMLPDLAEEIHLKANRDIVSSIFIDKAGKKVIIDRRKPTETDISGYDFKPIVTGEQQKKTKFR